MATVQITQVPETVLLMHDITDILAFEVKKELADRYFGFRRQIEEDTAAYLQRLTVSSLELENSIGLTLIRCYLLLGDKNLIAAFLRLTGLPSDLFYDPYLLESPTIRRRAFAGMNLFGITRRGRFTNLLLDSYDTLKHQVDEYRKNLQELEEEQETIREEINLFYRKNDIDTILTFLRRLDHPGLHELGASLPPGAGSGPGLTDQLRMHPPQPANEVLPPLPPLPPRSAIRRQLKMIAHDAYKLNQDIDLRTLTK